MTHSFKMRLFSTMKANQCRGCAREPGPGETRLIGWKQRGARRGTTSPSNTRCMPTPNTHTHTYTPSLSPSLPPFAPVKTQRPPGALKCLHTLEIESNGINQETFFSPLLPPPLFHPPPLSLISFPLFFSSSIWRLQALCRDMRRN